jgi:hypothetical protein
LAEESQLARGGLHGPPFDISNRIRDQAPRERERVRQNLENDPVTVMCAAPVSTGRAGDCLEVQHWSQLRESAQSALDSGLEEELMHGDQLHLPLHR